MVLSLATDTLSHTHWLHSHLLLLESLKALRSLALILIVVWCYILLKSEQGASLNATAGVVVVVEKNFLMFPPKKKRNLFLLLFLTHSHRRRHHHRHFFNDKWFHFVYENINLCLLKCNVFFLPPLPPLFVENYIFILMLQHIFGWYQNNKRREEEEEKHNNIGERGKLVKMWKYVVCNIRSEI